VAVKAIGAQRRRPWLGTLRTPDGRQLALDWVLLTGSVALATASSSPDQWHPTGAVLALVALAIVAHLLKLDTRTVRISSTLTVLVVIMALFGPAPAVLGGCLSMLVDRAIHRTPAARWVLANLATFATLGIVGGLWFELLDDWLDHDHGGLLFAGIVAVSMLALTALNLLLIVVPLSIRHGTGIHRAFTVNLLAVHPVAVDAVEIRAVRVSSLITSAMTSSARNAMTATIGRHCSLVNSSVPRLDLH